MTELKEELVRCRRESLHAKPGKRWKSSDEALSCANEHLSKYNLHYMRNLEDMQKWMTDKMMKAESVEQLDDGTYVISLIALVIRHSGPDHERHSIYVLHGRAYQQRLRQLRSSMKPSQFRDHKAGALNHEAIGLMCTAKCALMTRMWEVLLPGSDEPLTHLGAVQRAVKLLWRALKLRQCKIGHPALDAVKKSYRMALKLLTWAKNNLCQIQYLWASPRCYLEGDGSHSYLSKL